VTLDPTGNGVQLAAGLLEGQLRQAVKGFVLLRKARLELNRPDEAERLGAELDALTWRDLSPEEQAQCPGLLVVGDSASLASSGLAQTIWALGSQLPLRLLLLADLDLGLAGPAGLPVRPASLPDPSLELPLLALSQRGAFIAQSALGAPDHLLASLEGAFEHPGPALVQLYAPSPGQHGFAPALTLERSQQAVASRLLPLFRYDPRGEGVFGSRIQLAGNPEPLAPWAATAEGEPLTPAHWALGETRFAACFEPLAEDAADALPLAEWLQLAAPDQARKHPYLTRTGTGAMEQRLALTSDLARVCLQRQQAWRTLQELAGLVTPFTERVRQEAEAAVAAERAAELSALRGDYEHRLAEQHDQQLEETRQAMRERLLQLAGYQTETTE
jgi:pyruvate-ferredoxin/flavodoxin oxidoreductase